MMNCELRIANCGLKALRLGAAAWLCFVLSSAAVTTNLVQATNTPAANTSTNTSNRTDFSAFKVIADRNIFSANRSGRVASRGSRKPTKVETFTLVGTIDYSKGVFAVFDGSSSALSKKVKTGDSIAGFKVSDVDLDHVTIATTNGAATVLHVGSQMRRVDDGDWALGSGPTPVVAKAESSEKSDETASAGSSTNSESSDEPAPSAAENDVLKKLMQKRKAEVKNEAE